MTNQLTEVRLLSVPLSKDYKHTLYFESRKAQKDYFQAQTKMSINQTSYQRKERYISYPAYIEDIKANGCNYLMYYNALSSTLPGRTYYAFITDMVYKSDEVTWIYFEIDVLQTYFMDYTVLPSFVEREHCADDTFGLHTIPENLECGEFVCQYSDSVTELQDCAIVMGRTEKIVSSSDATTNPDYKFEPMGGLRYDGLYSGVAYTAFTNGDNGIPALNDIIEAYAEGGKNDSIKCLFMYPLQLLDVNWGTDDMSIGSITGRENPKTITKIFSRRYDSRKGSYQIRNNKLHTFPYNYILLANNNGGSAVYKFEFFEDGISGDNPTFLIQGCLTPGGSIRLIPMNYKGLSHNYEEGMNLGKYPICNWASDEYTNWLTQNSVNIGVNIASGVGQIVAGVAMGLGTGGLGWAVGGGSVVGGVSTIAGQLTQIHEMSFTSPQSRGNINCGDVISASKTNTFFFNHMAIADEYAQIIDNFFDMFGYKTSLVKVPEKAHRESYWYTKTIDANITGTISQDDLDKIKECYNRGITFWRAGKTIGDYSQSNNTL